MRGFVLNDACEFEEEVASAFFVVESLPVSCDAECLAGEPGEAYVEVGNSVAGDGGDVAGVYFYGVVEFECFCGVRVDFVCVDGFEFVCLLESEVYAAYAGEEGSECVFLYVSHVFPVLFRGVILAQGSVWGMLWFVGGGDGNRTRVNGFADRHLATRSHRHGVETFG